MMDDESVVSFDQGIDRASISTVRRDLHKIAALACTAAIAISGVPTCVLIFIGARAGLE